MQETLTANKRKNIIFVLILVFIIIVAVSIFLCFKLKCKKQNYFLEQEFYIVYSEKSKKQNSLEENQKIVKNMGGSGEIYFSNDYYYLTLSSYQKKEDAESVVGQINTIFPDAGILKLTINKISNKNKTYIKENKNLLEFFIFINKFRNQIFEYEVKFLSDSVTDRGMTVFYLENKMKLEQFVKSTSEFDGKMKDDILKFCNLALLYINNFFNEFFESNKKHSLVTSLTINIALASADLINNL